MLRTRRLPWSRGRGVCAAITAPLTTAASSSKPPPVSNVESSPGLRIGVVGLGAIGTIFFAKLARLAAAPPHDKSSPRVRSIDAFVRPRQLTAWLNEEKQALHMTLVPSSTSGNEGVQDGSKGRTDLRFLPAESSEESSELMAVAADAPSVRVRTLRPVRGQVLAESDQIDVVLLAVKAYDSAAAIRELRRSDYAPLFKRDALCVLLQNGLGEGLPSIASASDREAQDNSCNWQFANGVTFVGGRVASFGSVVTSGIETGATFLAPVGGSQALQQDPGKMEALAAVLQAAGLRCEVLSAEKMQATLWRKLIVNAAINPIASLLDGPNKSVGACEWSRHCVSMVVGEAFAVAQSEHVPLDCTQEELEEEVLRVATNTGANICSMLSDLRRGSRTEIDAISGRIVAAGKRHGVPTPANELLLSLVKAREEMSERTRP